MNTPIWTLQVEVQPGEPLGALQGRISLATVGMEGEPADPFVIDVNGRIVPDIIVEPAAMHFTQLGGTSASRIDAKLRCLIPGSRVAVLSTRIEGTPVADQLRVEAVAKELDSAGRSAEWTLYLSAHPSLAGKSFSGTLLIELDDPTAGTIEVPIGSRTAP